MTAYNLFATLSDDDKKVIDEYINDYAPLNSDNANYYNKKSLGVILREWNDKNQDLFKLFGEELIVHRLYSYKQTMEGLVNEFNLHKDDDAYRNFVSWWNWGIKHNANVNFELDGISNMYFYSKYFFIEEAYSFNNLASNSYQGEEFKVLFGDGTILKVCRGMKPMKILHKFIEKFGTEKDEQMFEEFRLWHSRLLNQKTIDGELCLSIHPLDYMTMSDNANGWTSCMRWSDKWGHADAGDYRTGTMECMNSPYIIVAYLHDPRHVMSIGDYEWNSKRWRELFIVNEGCISEIKGYPYQDENLTNACISWIKELAIKNMGWIYDNEEYNMTDPILKVENESLYLDFVKPQHMYKDFGVLRKHAGRINLDYLRTSKKFYCNNIKGMDGSIMRYIDIPYGGQATCAFCGVILDDDSYERVDNVVLCDRCESITRCRCCGDPITDDDSYYIEELDDYVCYDCYTNECLMDNFDGTMHLDENMEKVSLLLGYDHRGAPVYYDREAYVYEPDWNYSYKDVMKESPKCVNGVCYVTLDMVWNSKERAFCNAFDIYPTNLDKFYATCIDEYYLEYDYNHNPLYEEDEEE